MYPTTGIFKSFPMSRVEFQAVASLGLLENTMAETYKSLKEMNSPRPFNYLKYK